MNNSLLLTIIFFALSPHILAADLRQNLHEQSPEHLFSVGKLLVPSEKFIDGERQAFTEECSATLLYKRGSSDLVLSSWHCIEHYTNLGKPIIFKIPNKSNQWLERTANILKAGLSMKNDWLLLRLEQAIHNDLTIQSLLTEKFEPPLTAAGFSSDPHIGRNGEQLSYQEGCKLSRESLYEHQITLDCWAYKGASGGAIFSEGKLAGVISQGDNNGRISIVTISSILPAIERYLGK